MIEHRVALTTQLFHEHLISKLVFLEWLVAQLKTVHLGQLPFVQHFAESQLGAYTACEPICRSLLEACFLRLAELRDSAVSASELSQALERTCQLIFLDAPDAFVFPRLWLNYRPLLQTILRAPDMRPSEARFIDIERRTNALLLLSQPKASTSQLLNKVEAIKLLDAIAHPCDMDTIKDAMTSLKGPVTDKAELLLNWATTRERQGSHRRYAAASLLAHFRSVGLLTVPEVNNIILGWLDTADSSDTPRDVVVVLLAELHKAGLFNVGKYLERLLAQGFDSRATRWVRCFLTFPLSVLTRFLEHDTTCRDGSSPSDL